jgi:hypothetical protein
MTNFTQIILNSDDALATGTSANFTTTLANKITLNAFQNWEVALLSASFPTPEIYTNKAITIECDLAEFSFVGSERKRVVFKTNQHLQTKLQNEITHVIPLTVNYVKLTTVSFNTINIKIEDIDGLAVPTGLPSTVTIGIRPAV